MKIVIWGYGRFGSLLYKIVAKHWEGELDLVVVSEQELENTIKKQSLAGAVVDADLLLPCVPISSFEQAILKLSKLELAEKLVVADVCSVKVVPAEVMSRLLPNNVGIVATHPMWGPDSSEDGTKLADLKFIYKNIRDNGNKVVEKYLQLWSNLGQQLIELTPEEHDHQAAYTHAYAFLIGKLGIMLDVRRNNISTKGFEGVLYNQEAVENDSDELFQDMNTYNPYAKVMRQRFAESLDQIEKQLSEYNQSLDT